MTTLLSPIGLLWGEARAEAPPRWWVAQPVASDDGTPWSVRVETNDAAPAGLGGEALFTMAYVTVRGAASAVLRLTPVINDESSVTRAHPDGTVTIVQPTFAVAQGLAGVPLQTRTIEVPLMQRVVSTTNGADYLTALRGERCRIRIDSDVPFGVGEFRIEQVELEYEVMRRGQFATVAPQ